MSLISLRTLLPLAVDSVRAPRPTFARLMQISISREALWQALILVVILSVLLADATTRVVLMGRDTEVEAVMLSPILFSAVQLGVLVLTIFSIFWVGRAMGGTGSFRGGLLVVVWLQFVMICLQLVQSVAMLLVPPLSGIVVIAGLVIFMWLLTNFIAELHGFASLGRVFGMIMFCLIGVALGLAFLLTLIGVGVPQ